ncbi:MAG TPA: response regulator [Candidatus Acidoferrales bacterium]|nr:response regulator [Candidatus Acidoferrales bacterium]
MQRRTLIVDDEPAECELIHAVLSSSGIETLTLTSGAEAEHYLRDEKFAAALFDFRMPPPDGLELARQARSSGINQMTPIILVSDDQSTGAVSQGFAAGASFFLYKPIDKARLLKLIRATQGAVEHERRRFRRIPFQSRVRLDSEKGEWEGETIDVSLNGMLVKCPRSIPAGSPIHVSLYLSPEMKPVVGFGSVVRVLGGNRMGIQLNQLTMAESGRLQDFLLPLILRERPEANLANIQT